MFQTENPALLIIDCQQAIDHFAASERSNPDAEENIQALLARWRDRALPVVHIRHASKHEASPYHPSKSTYQFKDEVAPVDGELVITKSENCAFISTPLHEHLVAGNVNELVVCGVLTHHSVDATVRYASGLGFRVVLPEPCTASFAITLRSGEVVPSEQVQEIFLANLNGEYCDVVSQVHV